MAKPTQQQVSFIESVRPYAENTGKALGIDPDFIIAQAALESGWGSKAPGNNFFGIKADKRWTGPVNNLGTREVVNGNDVKMSQPFRAYENAQESFDDFGKFLQNNPRYAQVLKSGNDPAAYATGLQSAGYATDPKYAQGVLNTISSVKGVGGTSLAKASPDNPPVAIDAPVTTLAQAVPTAPTVAPADRGPLPIGYVAAAPEGWAAMQKAMPSDITPQDLNFNVKPVHMANMPSPQQVAINFSPFQRLRGRA